MTLNDKDAQRRIWCMFGDDQAKMYGPTQLVFVEEGDEFPYVDFYGDRYKLCRECTPEELAGRKLTQPPKPWSDRVTQWAIDRNIIPGSTADRQFFKLVEEVGELAVGLQKRDRKLIRDSLGDIGVMVNNIAELSEMTFDECLEAAWEEIKDRKGRIVNGTFVKEATN